MIKRYDFKNALQKKKCWLLTILFTIISMLIFFFTWLICEVKLDFFSVSVIFLIVFWQFYIINKFFITFECSNRVKIKSTIYSLLFLLSLSFIIIILGEISYSSFFDAPAKITTLVVTLFIFLTPVARFFSGYLNMNLTEKKLTFLYWFYTAIFSIIIGFFLNFAFTILEFTIISPLIIGALCIFYFLSMVLTFDKFTLFNKRKQVKRFGINLLILLIFIALGGVFYFWIVNKF